MAKRRHRLHSAHVRECVLLPCVGGSTTGSGRGHERDGDGPMMRGVLGRDALWGTTQLTNAFRDRSDTSRYGPPTHR